MSADAPVKETNKPFAREQDLIKRYKALLKREDVPAEEYAAALSEITEEYDRLFTDTKLLTSLGDRLQRKMRSANSMLQQQQEEILQINDALKATNNDLKLTIDELNRVRASRKAQTYLFMIVFVLFIVSESLEEVFDSVLDNFWVSMVFKALLLLLFKPLESFMEKLLLRRSMDKDKRAIILKHFGRVPI